MQDKRFPIQGGFTVTWEAAEIAYRMYAKKFGTTQSLSRLAERGGFGIEEYVKLHCAATNRNIEHALYEGDIRVENKFREVSQTNLDYFTLLADLHKLRERYLGSLSLREYNGPTNEEYAEAIRKCIADIEQILRVGITEGEEQCP